MDFSGNKILGIDANVFFAVIFCLLFLILGIVSFQFYGYINGGTPNSAFSAGTGIGVSLFPNRQPQQQVILAQPNSR
jgi:hypothetical protein